MRVMALDIGDVRIGVALSDPLLLTAQGLRTIHRSNIRKDTSEIIEIIKEEGVTELIIGLPVSLSGEDTEQTEKIRSFATKLENKMRSSGLKDIIVAYSDERFSSVIANNVLLEADVKRQDRKNVIDKMAASVILQSYLDHKNISK